MLCVCVVCLLSSWTFAAVCQCAGNF